MQWLANLLAAPLVVRLLAAALVALLLAHPAGRLLGGELCGLWSSKQPLVLPSRPGTSAPVVE